MGAGTRNSPIAIDDSEDEVFHELYQSSDAKASPQTGLTNLTEDRRMLSPSPPALPFPPETFHRHSDSSTMHLDKKRKRTSSFTSQDIAVASSSNGQRVHPSLVNRLSQPESKKARKRRRKAERQALEEARLQNINWLNNTMLYPSSFPSNLPHPPPLSTWGNMNIYTPYTPPPLHVPQDLSYPSSQNLPTYIYPYETLPRQSTYDRYNLRCHSPSPPSLPSTSDWVSSMALAADHSLNQRNPPSESPLSIQAPPPPSLPPPIPSPKISAPLAAAPKAVEHHALPSKPPPPRSTSPIGMMPDLDPSSKHGIFHISASTREAGSEMKKRSTSYMPNPARTLVIEQLPKSHRNPDFINTWSRSACGSLPVHIFIDAQGGKALIEFATAELARKTWASPKLGANIAGMKTQQLKGKIREDLIKVWWYRVEGVGARAGVGEIEEGEIEGDTSMEKEGEVVPKKETKKERKARLAKERDAKKQREADLRKAREAQRLEWRVIQQQVELGESSDTLSQVVDATPTSSHGSLRPMFYNDGSRPPPFDTAPSSYTSANGSHTFSWNSENSAQLSQQFQPPPSADVYVNRTAYGASLQNDEDDRESIASSAGRSESHVTSVLAMNTTTSQGDDLDDYDEMDMDLDEASPISVSVPVLPPTLPVRSALPAPPTLEIVAQPAKPPVQKPPPSYLPSAMAPLFVPRSQHLPPPVHNPPLATQKPVSMSTAAPPPKAPTPPRPTPSLAMPQPKAPPRSQATNLAAPPPPRNVSTASLAAAAPTPTPPEPKAMKSAPTEPSYTKRALMARQKELEEKIAKSKMELAAVASRASAPASAPQPQPQVKPAMDLGEKQAMEDRLRRLVLQSRKPAVQAEPPPAPAAPSGRPDQLHAESPVGVALAGAGAVSVLDSAHVDGGFSLEDMAVSFITQTIETMKAQPTSVGVAPLPSARGAPPSDVRFELAAKHRRLEEHILESKALMTQLAQARTKSEKDGIMRVMREKTRQFEEASVAHANAVATSNMNKSHSSRTAATTQQFRITRWPDNCRDSTVLIVSDDEDDDDEDEDED
ncbi:hypothetical protein HYPSUDRAFT_53019 [Hypholoma sublateritium FD-334 SS-4]|uniref:Uncharacterized protein n=1 Tax=Hypholoma sublateritium (strain FD-334 SS-4) TaxID=945553 RepID=A0A0D2P3G2_HYPSF|nr:hypothetical protein HYPSUDRAFT_53019 [Hypholoma sublateritium FD-334 SS-4]